MRKSFEIKPLDEWWVNLEQEPSPEVRLVVAVIDRALRDLGINMRSVRPPDRRAALAWFESTSEEPWTFLWCCAEADCSPRYIISLFKIFESGDPYGFKQRVSRRRHA